MHGITLASLAAVAVMLAPRTPWAAPGALDATFGSGGTVITDTGASFESDVANAVAVQADGKLVAVGYTENEFVTAEDFLLLRYNANGSLDSTFGTGGKVETDLGGADPDVASALAVQADGKLVVAGWTRVSFSSTDIALARYNTDGSLDTAFGTGGKVITAAGTGASSALGLVVQADGRLVAAGSATVGSGGSDFALVRYNTDGSLDTTFGTGGTVTTDFGTDWDSASALALQADGKLVAAGSVARKYDVGYGPARHEFALARYNADGSLDTTFGTGGEVTTNVGSDYRANALVVQVDGKLVVVGDNPVTGNSHIALVRYNPDGTLDPSFGNEGKVITSFVEFGGEGASGLAVQPDGKLVAAGYTDFTNGFNSSGSNVLMVRYNHDGTLDGSFGSGGRVTTDFGPHFDGAFAVALQSDGKLVAAGTQYTGGELNVALARYVGLELPYQSVLGKSFVVKDPQPGNDPSLRSIVVLGKEFTSDDTVGSDPLTNGATIDIFVNGASSANQVFTLPAGASVAGSAGWKELGNPVIGYSYTDALGTNGPVKTAAIKKANNGTFTLKATVKGALGPGPQPHVTVVPPAPGTDGRMRFTINGGATYCVAFGGAAGGLVKNTPSDTQDVTFKITSTPFVPTTEVGCP